MISIIYTKIAVALFMGLAWAGPNSAVSTAAEAAAAKAVADGNNASPGKQIFEDRSRATQQYALWLQQNPTASGETRQAKYQQLFSDSDNRFKSEMVAMERHMTATALRAGIIEQVKRKPAASADLAAGDEPAPKKKDKSKHKDGADKVKSARSASTEVQPAGEIATDGAKPVSFNKPTGAVAAPVGSENTSAAAPVSFK